MSAPHRPAPLDRRGIMRAATWSVPAAVVAGTSPAFAVSPQTPIVPVGQLRVGANTQGAAAFSGSRVDSSGNNYVRIDRFKVRNDGPDALPAGTLVLSVTIPEQWGTVVGLTSSFPFPTTRLTFSHSGRTATFTAKAGFGSLITGQDIDFCSPTSGTGVVALAFDITGDAYGSGLPIQASVSTTQAVAPNNFVGNTITDTTAGNVWSW